MSSPKNNKRNVQNLRDKCERFINYHTMFTMQDGSTFDGIIEGLDGDCVIVLGG